MSDSSAIYSVDQTFHLKRYDDKIIDPRGFLFIFEPPRPNSRYVIGADPTNGITGWSPFARLQNDHLTDNAAAVVLKCGRGRPNEPDFIPDKQVAEYAAPIDPYEFAKVLNGIGRFYGGNNEDGQALIIPEVWPGPGLPTLRELIGTYGYTNIWRWKYLDAQIIKPASALGWSSTSKSVRDLWIAGIRWIQSGGVLIESPWLIDEMTDCQMDQAKMRGGAIYGRHDDRVSALLFSGWAANEWSLEYETIPTSEIQARPVNWQASDCTLEQQEEAWEAKFEELAEEY